MTTLQEIMREMTTTIRAAYRAGMTDEGALVALYADQYDMRDDDGTAPEWLVEHVQDIMRAVDSE